MLGHDCIEVRQVHIGRFIFLYVGKNLKGGLIGEPLMGGITAIMTISPMRHLGQRKGSFPEVMMMKSRVFIMILCGGEGAPRLLRAWIKSFFLTLDARIPMCLILTNRLGRICSQNSRIKEVPLMVLDFCFLFLRS